MNEEIPIREETQVVDHTTKSPHIGTIVFMDLILGGINRFHESFDSDKEQVLVPPQEPMC